MRLIRRSVRKSVRSTAAIEGNVARRVALLGIFHGACLLSFSFHQRCEERAMSSGWIEFCVALDTGGGERGGERGRSGWEAANTFGNSLL